MLELITVGAPILVAAFGTMADGAYKEAGASLVKGLLAKVTSHKEQGILTDLVEQTADVEIEKDVTGILERVCKTEPALLAQLQTFVDEHQSKLPHKSQSNQQAVGNVSGSTVIQVNNQK